MTTGLHSTTNSTGVRGTTGPHDNEFPTECLMSHVDAPKVLPATSLPSFTHAPTFPLPQTSLESVPPMAHWTPEWQQRLSTLDLPSHLNFINSYFKSVIPMIQGTPDSPRLLHDAKLIQVRCIMAKKLGLGLHYGRRQVLVTKKQSHASTPAHTPYPYLYVHTRAFISLLRGGWTCKTSCYMGTRRSSYPASGATWLQATQSDWGRTGEW